MEARKEGSIMKNTVLLTSNKNKLKEFQKYIPEMTSEIGPDLDEVLGTSEEVIIYKALNIKEGQMVEDTILEVNGVEVVDIRYTGKNCVKSGDELVWTTKLGYNTGEEIQVFSGSVKGIARFDRLSDEAFGFDDIFQPIGSDLTLFEMGEEKEDFSARKFAINNYKTNVFSINRKIKDIPKWEGEYQC